LVTGGVESPAQPRYGPRSIWSHHYSDIRWLRRGPGRGLPKLLRWARPYLAGPVDAMFAWRDPLPWARLLFGLLKRRVRTHR
jgi:hypothetical protein